MDTICTLMNHEATPDCCGCWVFTFDETGYWAECNECGKRVNLVELLQMSEPSIMALLKAGYNLYQQVAIPSHDIIQNIASGATAYNRVLEIATPFAKKLLGDSDASRNNR